MSETEVKPKTKTELLSEMRELQAAYSRAAAELKAMSAAEEAAAYESRQLKRLEEFKGKYKFYAQEDGSTKEIDWEEVEKLIRSSFGTNQGYALGFDQTGQEGLGVDYGQGGAFTAMVEDEVEAQRFAARATRRKEFAAKAKGK